ncbi:MAG: hypothetical protein ACFFD4_34615 [Candidatus Odinarchaeota archaeon]
MTAKALKTHDKDVDPGFKESVTWEKEIRLLVRLASLACMALLLTEMTGLATDFILYLKIYLIIFLVVVFIAGLTIAYFQLRWVNEKRNKTTNLGGSVGIFGLFLTLLVTVGGFPELLNVTPPSYLLAVLGLGLLLIVAGIFAEITRLDELLVYWFRINAIYVGRLIGLIASLGILFTGIMTWNRSYDSYWPLLMILSGYFLGVITWYRHQYFKATCTSLNAVVTILGIYLSADPSVSTVPIFLISLGVAVTALLWMKEIINLVKKVIKTIAEAVTRTFQAIASFLIAVVAKTIQTYRSFVLFLCKNYIEILRYSATFIGIVSLGTGFVLTRWEPAWFGWFLVMLGAALLYAAWFNQINQFVKQSIKALRNAIVQTYNGFVSLLKATINAVVRTYHSFVLFLRKNHITIIRYSVTLIGALLFIWGILVIIILPDYFFESLVMMITGTVLLYAAWFYKVNHTIRQAIKAVIDASVRVYRAFSGFLKAASAAFVRIYRATVLFLRTYYVEMIRYIASIVSLAFMYAGIMTWDHSYSSYWPLIWFLSGYFLGVVTWYHHRYYRRTGTLLSTVMTILGLYLLVIHSVASLPVSAILVVLGAGVIAILWLTEVKNLVKKVFRSIIDAMARTYLAIASFLRAVTVAVAQTYRSSVLFLRTHYKEILRYSTTMIGDIIIITGFLLLPSDLLLGILAIVSGIVLLYVAWFHQVNQTIKQIIKAVIDAFVRAYRTASLFLRTYYKDILRYSATITGLLILFTGLGSAVMGITLEGALMTFTGVLLLLIVWFHEFKRIFNQVSDYITEKVRVFILFLRKYYIDIIRYSTTAIGAFLFNYGFLALFLWSFTWPGNQIAGPVLMLAGVLIICLSWFQQTKKVLYKFSQSICITLGYARKFLSSALTQLGQLIAVIIDSIIFISLMVLSISAVLYGMVLILSGLIDPSGSWTTQFLYNIPLLELLARVIQGPLYNETLLGFFAGLDPLILILSGAAFIAPGVIIALINFLMRESLKLSKLKKVTGKLFLPRSSPPEEQDLDKEGEL